ncbi:hypothetical protein EXE30_01645 [Acinetobacter halotolerans]|uniref:Uncharacterized protein n=1 Tax=Acinetobacter halotolerans TaxID=1752076 RepID=A0A4Q6XMG0_9GAMM|nr:hypothetical protein [Acinetobacter halotolerans]RZF56985.1 hypothetical protein EXE30_01645 [Acinetobacter halotolerans]
MQFRWLLLQYVSIGCVLTLGLSACDRDHSESAKQIQKQSNYEASVVQDEQPSFADDGVPLTKIAGQATLPYSGAGKRNLTQPSETGLTYVGRYHARIPCTDAFAGCVNQEKEAEYILNLLEDGSVYWINTSFGRLGIDSSHNVAKIEQTCNQVQWYAHEELNEIMVRCDAANISLYFKVNQNQDLVLNLEKIWNDNNGENQKFFKEYPFPEKAYEFKKIQ